MKILFINPPLNRLMGDEYIYLPIGLCMLASITRNALHETFVYNMDNPPIGSESFKEYQRVSKDVDGRDLILKNLSQDPINVWQELRGVLNDIKPDVVGITSLTVQIPIALKIAQICKMNNPETKVIIGGPHATCRPGELIESEVVDFVFSGEAEDGIIEFLEVLKNGGDPGKYRLVKGLSYKEDGIAHIAELIPFIDVDRYPMMARDLFVFPERYLNKNMGAMLTGRGCPFRCKYCSSPHLSGYKVRRRSIKNMVDEIEHIIKTYNVNEIMFSEDTFTFNEENVYKFYDMIKERGITLKWRSYTRLDFLSDKLLDVMMFSGCRQINVGVESGSDEMLKYIGKGITLKKICEKIDLLKRKGMAFSANFMFGFPEERREHVRETLDFISTKLKYHFAYSICIPNPGSRFFDDCIRLGIIDPDHIDWTYFNTRSTHANFTKYLSREDIYGYIEEVKKLADIYCSVKDPSTFSPYERCVTPATPVTCDKGEEAAR